MMTLKVTAFATLFLTSLIPANLRLPTQGEMQTGTICARKVLDWATEDCVTVSSAPLMGSIYVLGREHAIDPVGNNGIGTTQPAANLHIIGNRSRPLTGLSTVGGGNVKVTGTNTLYKDELEVGSAVQIGDFIGTVAEIQSQVCFFLMNPHPTGELNVTAFADRDLLRIDAGDGQPAMSVSANRTVGIGMPANDSALVASGIIESAGGFKFPDGSVQMQAASSGDSVPSGAILLWSGSLASIPAGWRLCDGGAGTPDLRDRFVIGAGLNYGPGATGGAASHAHSGSATASASDRRWVDDNSGGTDHYCSGENHQHSVVTDAASNLPPFYSLAYIIKL